MLYIHSSDLLFLSRTISESIVKERLSIARKKSLSNWWSHHSDPADNRKVLVDYLSIPIAWRAKHNLPAAQNVKAILAARVEEREQQLRESAMQKRQNTEQRELRAKQELLHETYNLLCVAKKEFHLYYNAIRNAYPTIYPEKCREFAEKTAVIKQIVCGHSRSPHSLEATTTVYYRLFPIQKEVSATAKNGLSNKLRHLMRLAQAQTLTDADVIKVAVDHRAVVKVQNRRSEFQMTFLQMMYAERRKITCRAAHTGLVKACLQLGEKPMSEANVKIIFREFRNNPALYTERYGQGAAQKQLPHASLIPALHRNTQWQWDAWTMPFWGLDFQRYSLDLIIDNHSRKILAYSLGKSENTELKLQTIESAMRQTGVFPGEIVLDKHSWTKTAVAARLMPETQKYGTVWTVTTNAQRNQIAERYNAYLDAICKDFEGYLGKNMTATGKDARPSPEALTDYAKTRNQKTEAEIRAIAAHIVMEYNRTGLAPLQGASPNEKYDASETVKAFNVTDTEILTLLRPVSEYKVTRGQINIKVGTVKHEFQLPANLIERYNNRVLNVVYEDLTEGIYVTDPATREELGCIPPKRKVHGAIPDQTDEDRRILNQQTGRRNGTETKGRKSATERIAAGLKQNPDAIALINTYALPKDIRQIANQDADLKRQLAIDGVNMDMVPIREQKSSAVAATGKTKQSPFTPVKNEIRKVTLAELRQSLNQ